MAELSSLRQWMQEHGMTQLALAEQLGVTPQHFNRVINGKEKLSGQIRWDFANRYGFELARELLGETIEEPAQ